MLPPLDNDKDWHLIDPVPPSTRTAAVNAAILAAQAACPASWSTNGLAGCLRAGVPGIDNGFAQIAAQLHAKAIKAGQPYVEGDPGKRVDALSVNGDAANKWEEWHLFYYGNGCLIGNPYKNTYLYTGSGGGEIPPTPTPTPPPVASCPFAPCPTRTWTAETLPPGWGQDEIGKPAYQYNSHPHTMGNIDSTPVVIRQEPFCASIGLSPMADGTLRASCPVRPDEHPQRVPVENWLLFGGPTRDGRNGQDCTPNNTTNPAAFLGGTGNCRMCNVPKSVCTDWY